VPWLAAELLPEEAGGDTSAISENVICKEARG